MLNNLQRGDRVTVLQRFGKDIEPVISGTLALIADANDWARVDAEDGTRLSILLSTNEGEAFLTLETRSGTLRTYIKTDRLSISRRPVAEAL